MIKSKSFTLILNYLLWWASDGELEICNTCITKNFGQYESIRCLNLNSNYDLKVILVSLLHVVKLHCRIKGQIKSDKMNERTKHRVQVKTQNTDFPSPSIEI